MMKYLPIPHANAKFKKYSFVLDFMNWGLIIGITLLQRSEISRIIATVSDESPAAKSLSFMKSCKFIDFLVNFRK